MIDEEWRPVVGWEGLYEVSSLGRVRSLDRIVRSRWDSERVRKGVFLNPVVNPGGYELVTLSRQGNLTTRRVHRLVCEAFHGPEPEGKPYVLHGDGNPSNNQESNLRWGSNSDNTLDSVRHGTHHLASRTHCKYGHAYSEDTDYRSPEGYRICRECHLEGVKKRYRKGLLAGDPRHGTNAGYAVWGCRCGICFAARKDYLGKRCE